MQEVLARNLYIGRLLHRESCTLVNLSAGPKPVKYGPIHTRGKRLALGNYVLSSELLLDHDSLYTVNVYTIASNLS